MYNTSVECLYNPKLRYVPIAVTGDPTTRHGIILAIESVIWNRPAFELLFVGPATRKKLTAMGILTIGDLAKRDVRELKRVLGKNGVTLW